MYDIIASRQPTSIKELQTITNNDYIKKLVFYICSITPIYKGTQEIILNGNMLDIINVIVDFHHINALE